MLQTFLHRGLNLLCGGVAEHPCPICTELRFLCVDGGFGLMVNGTQRVNVALAPKVWRFGNRYVVLIAQFLHIHL